MVLSGPWGVDSSLDDLIDRYYSLGTHDQAGNLPIKWIVDYFLRTMVYTIGKVFRTRFAYLTNREHMRYSIECMAPTVFNWCEGMLVILKYQLNKCIWGHLKQFIFGAVIVSFILQRVPHMRPQVAVSRLYAEDPRILRWVYVMARHGGGGSKVFYGSVFFHRLRN